MTNAYLIHGTSTRDDDWFPWLEEAADPQIQLNRLWLPAPFNPERQAWDQAVDDQIPVQDGLTLVAHSLGCLTAVRFVARHDLHDVCLLLVGAFDRPLPQYPTLTDFILPRPDYTQVRPKLSQATVIVFGDRGRSGRPLSPGNRDGQRPGSQTDRPRNRRPLFNQRWVPEVPARLDRARSAQ